MSDVTHRFGYDRVVDFGSGVSGMLEPPQPDMDYLTQAKTFLHRASNTNDVEERMSHLNAAAEMLARRLRNWSHRAQ